MKRAVLFSSLFLALILTGCGNSKKLVCSQKVSYVNVDTHMEFKDDILSKMWLEEKLDLTSFSDTQITELENSNICDEVKKSIPQFSEAFTNCKHNISNKTLTVNANIDIDLLYKNSDKKQVKYDEAKSNYESQGFTCK